MPKNNIKFWEGVKAKIGKVYAHLKHVWERFWILMGLSPSSLLILPVYMFIKKGVVGAKIIFALGVEKIKAGRG